MTTATLSADIGGTFTDVVLETADGLVSTKVLTTYDAPERAILAGMATVCARAGVTPEQIGRVIHGTTLATNALIERRGARTALITTEGFRDVIEMRTESRFEQYDLNLVLPEPLLPRNRRYVLRERIDATGQVRIAPSAEEIAAVVAQIRAGGYESVAVGFLHSYVNPAHEQAMRDALLAELPGLVVSLSCEVSPQMREYERFNTTIANAYVKPMMKGYLANLQRRLAEAGCAAPVYLMHSGGGIISLEGAAEFPVRLVESGPAGGAIFAAHVAAAHGAEKVLSFDMGGTTAKICLIKGQTPKTARVFEVARTYRFKKGSGMPISIPVIDMVEIGAGGGSLAHVDSMNQIRVGPESAGSEPGPACYGRGGTRPAVTDADLMLGRLDAGNFAGGAFALDPSASAAALDGVVGGALGLDTAGAAFGISEVVDENMANAARVHAVENGEDLSGYTMIAFGGAAPLHAGRLCEKLGIGTLLVPPGAGVGSAIGFLRAPFSFEATRTVPLRLSEFDPPAVRGLLAALRAEATGFVEDCAPGLAVEAGYRAYLRYVGQGWEIPVELPLALAEAPDADGFRALFEAEYERLFSRRVEGLDIEVTVWAVNATTPKPRPDPVAAPAAADGWSPGATRTVFDPALERMVEAAVARREELIPGRRIDGPAVIWEDETTIIVPSSRSATCRADGCIELTLKAEA
ncbi:hydantoinase/oxoprolinase family protein [Mangrovicoccus sp. HB161399]|uniref:hydantoinase/oxoprolinase family protein n=1 Tax=Mangrovicoccus sp. HB161399 TaxID=2720392 RepID=UPI001556B412|nr:hydantoinase/oxoprolinase family protein [Mangrovicoccus sp. HB161399]